MPVTTRSSISSASSNATLSSETLSEASFHSIPPPRRRKSTRVRPDGEERRWTYYSTESTPKPTSCHTRQAPPPPRAKNSSYNVPHSEPPKCKHCRRRTPRGTSSSSSWLWMSYFLHIPLLMLYFTGGAHGPTDAQVGLMLMFAAVLIWMIVMLAFQNCCLKISLCCQSCWLVLTQVAVVILILALACAVILWEKDRQEVLASVSLRRIDRFGRRSMFY